MTPSLRASARHWLAGLVLAAAGVGINRMLAPCFSSQQTRAAFALGGELVALSGLLVIMLGVRRRIRLAEQANQSAPLV